MRRLARPCSLLGLGLLLAGCHEPVSAQVQTPTEATDEPAPDPEPEPEAPTALQGTHVVVRSGARFYPSAEAEQPVETRSYLPDDEAPRGSLTTHSVGWVKALGGQTETRVEVLSLTKDDPKGDCGRHFEGLEDIELRMWVEREELLEVTTTFAKLRYSDGSGLDLPPGVPILPSSPISPALDEQAAAEPGPWVDAWGFARSLAGGVFSEDAPLRTGLSFVPEARPELGPQASVPEHMMLGGREYQGWWVEQGVPIQEGDQQFVLMRGTCLDIRARVVDEIPEGAEGLGFFGFGGGGGGYGMDERRLLSAPAGATLYWPDGSVAGELREQLRANRVKAPGEGYCAYYGVGDKTRDLVLCLSPDDTKVLQLGHVWGENTKWKTKPEDASGAERNLDQRLRRLLVPCVSRAIELDPAFDLRVRVRLDIDKPSKGSENPKAWTSVKFEGKPKGLSAELRQCMQTELETWRPSSLVGNGVRVDVHMSATKPKP